MFRRDAIKGCGRTGAAERAILDRLQNEWPGSIDLWACHLQDPVTHAEFLEGCLALQDEGLIMYEALLAGAGPSPMVIGASITHKGRAVLRADH